MSLVAHNSAMRGEAQKQESFNLEDWKSRERVVRLELGLDCASEVDPGASVRLWHTSHNLASYMGSP